MTDRIRDQNFALNCKSSSPIDDCYGQAGLTESEYILHQALDLYGAKFVNEDNLHRYHSMAHTVFEKARKMLQELSLLQTAEFHPTALSKQNDMKRKYKRSTPLGKELGSE
jgi:hypothetical protein